MENVRKNRDIRLATIEKKRNVLLSEQNYDTTKLYPENLFAIKMKKTPQILLNRPVYLCLSLSEFSKIVMYEFCYDYIKPQLQFIIYVKTNGIYKDIAEDVETRFYTLNYELDRPFPKGKKLD